MKEQPQERYFINAAIRLPTVNLIDHEGKNLGVIPTNKALELAKQQGLDLVQVSPPTKARPATVKIMDFGKFKYDLGKQKKAQEKKQRENEIRFKEIQMKPKIGEHDLDIKKKHCAEFLNEGYRVKIVIVFEGREIDHIRLSKSLLDQFLEGLPSYKVLNKPALDETSKKPKLIMIIEKDAA